MYVLSQSFEWIYRLQIITPKGSGVKTVSLSVCSSYELRLYGQGESSM